MATVSVVGGGDASGGDSGGGSLPASRRVTLNDVRAVPLPTDADADPAASGSSGGTASVRAPPSPGSAAVEPLDLQNARLRAEVAALRAAEAARAATRAAGVASRAATPDGAASGAPPSPDAAARAYAAALAARDDVLEGVTRSLGEARDAVAAHAARVAELENALARVRVTDAGIDAPEP